MGATILNSRWAGREATFVFLVGVMSLCGCGSSAPGFTPKLSSTGSDAASDGQGDVSLTDAGAASPDTLEDSGRTAADTAVFDAGETDPGGPDTGTSDTGTSDTGSSDTGKVDTGKADTSPADTGAPDTGTSDTGTPDTGASDTGASDTGASDTGATDTGASDTTKASVCGDLVCDPSEKGACSFDCSTTGLQIWSCTQSKCAAQTSACQSTPACVTAVGAALSCADACTVLDQACITKCQLQLGGQPQATSLLTCALVGGCIITSSAICGDGTCNGSETPVNCPLDCKTVCGDGKCELPESVLTCAKDCAPTFPPCGNGTCDPNETATSCALDCDKAVNAIYACVKGKCPTQAATCLNDATCTTLVNDAVQCAVKCTPGNTLCLNSCGAKALGNPVASSLITCGLSCFISP